MCSGIFSDLFVHGNRIVLTDIIGNLNHFHSYGPGTQGDLNLVTGFDLIAGFCNFSVYCNAAIIAGLVGNGTALDQPGNLQVFIQSHLTSRQRPSESCLP